MSDTTSQDEVRSQQIALLRRILAKRSHPNARSISVKKIQAELDALSKGGDE